jgi:hypothetical protein
VTLFAQDGMFKLAKTNGCECEAAYKLQPPLRIHSPSFQLQLLKLSKMSKVTEKISATAEVAKQATIEATSKAKEGAYKAAAVSENVDSGTRFEAAKGALEAHTSAQTASVKKDVALEKSGLPVAAEKISAAGQNVMQKTTEMASAAAKPVVDTSSALASVVQHGTLQAKHEAQEVTPIQLFTSAIRLINT